MTLAEKIASAVGIITVLGILGAGLMWASKTYAHVNKVPKLEERMTTVEGKQEAIIRLQCLTLNRLGIVPEACYSYP